MKRLFPKFVKKAHSWCVTEQLGEVALKGKTKTVQKQHWFDSLESAMKFYKQ